MRYIFTLVLLFATSTAFAGQQYYNFPDATILNDADRVLIYQGAGGNKNITGSTLKSEVLGGSGALVKQAVPGASNYARIVEIKNQSGVITSWINAKGQMIFGTPKPLAVDSVYPANGATGVAISTIPYVQFNKTTLVSISTAYIQGDSTPPTNGNEYGFDSQGIKWGWPATLEANTTYTIKVLRASIQQTDGETASSCGTAMTDVSGVCTSTFTTAP